VPMVSTPLSPAEPNAVKDYVVDFATELGAGNDLSAATWTIAVRSTVSGYVPDVNPASHLTGPSTRTGTTTKQRVSDLQAGNDYTLSVLGTGTDGQKTTLWGVVSCRDSGSTVVKLPGQQVGFDYLAWLHTFPEFEAVGEAEAYGYWTQANLYLRNDGTGPVADNAVQSALLNLLTAHLAAQHAAGQGLAGSPFVGPVSSASEGSVSVSGTPLAATGTQAWYLTTRYGAEFWAATAAYRTFRYRAAPPRVFDPLWGFGRRGWSGG
jgi:hypothetical protein